jgi:tryptophan synthase alpha chain
VSRLGSTFRALREAGRKALVPFITAGDPLAQVTVPAMHALVRGGADILELGMPFSDPEADGPVIQAASERALAAGFRLPMLFDIVREFRRDDAATPVVLMGYLNNIERFGAERFADAAHEAGVDGVIVVNMPPEEAEPFKTMLAERDIDVIFLIAPTTTEARSRRILSEASGFAYYVSLRGVTGAAGLDVGGIASHLSSLRAITSVPLLVGFGIKDGASARQVAEVADGVIIGAVVVSTIAGLTEAPDDIPGALQRQLREFRTAMDR